MSLEVTAVQAAYLAHVSEQTVRKWIQTGRLPARKVAKSGQPAAWSIAVDGLALMPGVKVDADRLRELELGEAHTAEGLAARVSILERQLRAAEQRIRTLEARQSAGAPSSAFADASPGALEWKSGGLDATYPYPDVWSGEAPESAHRRAPTAILEASPRRPLSSNVAGGLRTFADAGRWLARHGVNERTPKTWQDWRATELTPRGILEDAIRRRAEADRAGNWRVMWRLEQCGDPGCVCRELLPPA